MSFSYEPQEYKKSWLNAQNIRHIRLEMLEDDIQLTLEPELNVLGSTKIFIWLIL